MPPWFIPFIPLPPNWPWPMPPWFCWPPIWSSNKSKRHYCCDVVVEKKNIW
jgi:hypothetical protein